MVATYTGLVGYNFFEDRDDAMLVKFRKKVHNQQSSIYFETDEESFRFGGSFNLDVRDKNFAVAMLATNEVLRITLHEDEAFVEKTPIANWETVLANIAYAYLLNFEPNVLLGGQR